MSRWISVDEQMPPPWRPREADGLPEPTCYIVTDCESVWVDEMWTAGFSQQASGIKYWMHLPKPPPE